MPRYFIEVAYRGSNYSGFQRQENANTIQFEIEKAFAVIHREPVRLTGSSRTDAGVHALQNYFHFDFEAPVNERFAYKMNAILPPDIVVRKIHTMPGSAHSRFDAVAREYEYHIYRHKDPFLQGLAFYYPFKLEEDLLHEAASILLGQTNFYAFTKTNTQAKNFRCVIEKSNWKKEGEQFVFNIKANRFLRGMVRLLTASMLQVARNRISIQEFKNLFEEERKCGFSVPPEGLYLTSVNYPEKYFL
jgi:tRNA pseudouridine38-40 synthase